MNETLIDFIQMDYKTKFFTQQNTTVKQCNTQDEIEISSRKSTDAIKKTGNISSGAPNPKHCSATTIINNRTGKQF